MYRFNQAERKSSLYLFSLYSSSETMNCKPLHRKTFTTLLHEVYTSKRKHKKMTREKKFITLLQLLPSSVYTLKHKKHTALGKCNCV